MTDIEGNKQLAKELPFAMNRSDTQWFLDNYAKGETGAIIDI